MAPGTSIPIRAMRGAAIEARSASTETVPRPRSSSPFSKRSAPGKALRSSSTEKSIGRRETPHPGPLPPGEGAESRPPAAPLRLPLQVRVAGEDGLEFAVDGLDLVLLDG